MVQRQFYECLSLRRSWATGQGCVRATDDPGASPPCRWRGRGDDAPAKPNGSSRIGWSIDRARGLAVGALGTVQGGIGSWPVGGHEVAREMRTGSDTVRRFGWLAIVLVSAGCGQPASASSAPSASAAVPAVMSSTPLTAASPIPTPLPVTRTSCPASDLRVTITNSSAAGGSAGGWLRFENTGKAACVLSGFPTLVGISPDGQRTTAKHSSNLLDAPVVTGTPQVTIEPKASAFAAFVAGDNPVGNSPSCPPSYEALEVTPPGGTSATRLSSFIAWLNQDLPACSGIEVMPVIGSDELPSSLATLRP